MSFTNYIEQIKKAIIKKLKWEKIDSCYIALNPIEDYLIYSKQPVNKKNYYNYIWRGILNEIQKGRSTQKDITQFICVDTAIMFNLTIMYLARIVGGKYV